MTRYAAIALLYKTFVALRNHAEWVEQRMCSDERQLREHQQAIDDWMGPGGFEGWRVRRKVKMAAAREKRLLGKPEKRPKKGGR